MSDMQLRIFGIHREHFSLSIRSLPSFIFKHFIFPQNNFGRQLANTVVRVLVKEKRRKRKIEKRKILNIINLRENSITDGICVCKDLQVAQSNASGGD